MNQWRTRSQYCAKGGAWITGSSSVKATSGWQLQAASCSPRHSSAGTVASPRNRALGTPRRCSRLTEWRRPCAGRESMSRRPTTIGWAQPPSADQERRMFPPRSVPACVRPNPTGSVSHARWSVLPGGYRARWPRRRRRRSRPDGCKPFLPWAREPAGRPAAAGDRRDGPGRPSRPATGPARGRAGRSRSATRCGSAQSMVTPDTKFAT